MYNFSTFNARAKESYDWLAKEFGGLRSGRAAPAILDGVFVESYGSTVPVKHLATISLEDPRTLLITPFDSGTGKDIEKAIISANIGLSVSASDGGIRVHFPELTAETRTALLKIGKEKLEQARVTIRKHRDETIKDIEQQEKQGGMGEDEKFRLKKDLEKLMEAENKKLQEAFERKEREIAG